ncbi:dihydrofolate reductase [Dyella psychrodurans]|uniref:Dihydrofolate reductase n=1 Tax=Dyella psychrodurans TaxID=1927960 RepID=A0A370XAB0_9GAMM|nr:dihydrofolate reductase [Dyella psychrodurans]RDS85339.1 dihydrofolate reductase [Dyella psychrodurans]
MAISLIAALDENFAIGRKGQLPWHLPDDLRWFKQLTVGKYVLMGYNTAVSIGKALPNRENLVLSRRHEAPFPGQVTVRSIEEAQARSNGTGLMVIGGGKVFHDALPMAQRLYLTWVGAAVDGADTFFPGIHFSDWVEVKRTHHKKDSDHSYDFDMVEYIRNS